MANQTDIPEGSPLWVKILATFGLQTLLIVVLLGTILGWLPSPLIDTLRRTEYHAWQTRVIMTAICYSQGVPNKYQCEPWKPEPNGTRRE